MDVKYVANLARINLSADEARKLQRQLEDILSFFKNLQEVDTSKTPPCSHVLPIKNIFRKDEAKNSLKKEQVLENAPEKNKDFTIVPKVIQE